MMTKVAKLAAAQPIQFALGVALVAGVGYFLVRHVGASAARAAAGVVTGHNALTTGTPYEGKGVVGTLAGAANAASGGSLRSIGEALGGWFYDVTHREYDPSAGLQTPAKTVADGARKTDSLWGPIGSVSLRSH